MPLYEYACDSCGARFERIQKFSDPLVTECPTCGQPVRKLLSSPAFQFKGSGWYATDYPKSGAGDKSGKPADAGKSDPPASSSGTSTDSTSKSDAPASKPAAPVTK